MTTNISGSNAPTDSRTEVKPLICTSIIGTNFYCLGVRGFSLLTDRVLMFYLLLCGIIVIVSSENAQLAGVDFSSPGIVIAYLLVGPGVVVVWFALLTLIGTRLAIKGYLKRFYLPFATIPAAFYLHWSMGLMTTWILGKWVPLMVWEELYRDLLIIICLEAIFGRFVAHETSHFCSVEEQEAINAERDGNGLTDAQNGVGAERRPTGLNPVRNEEKSITHIQAGVHLLPMKELLCVRSEGHYLTFVLFNREIRVRGVLRDFAKDMGLGCGTQVNRSTWVRFGAIDKVEVNNGKWDIHLQNGKVERIANVRRQGFEIAYEEYRSVEERDA